MAYLLSPKANRNSLSWCPKKRASSLSRNLWNIGNVGMKPIFISAHLPISLVGEVADTSRTILSFPLRCVQRPPVVETLWTLVFPPPPSSTKICVDFYMEVKINTKIVHVAFHCGNAGAVVTVQNQSLNVTE